MKAICLATQLTQEQHAEAHADPRFAPTYNMTKGKEYLVLGISFIRNSPIYGNATLFEIEDNAGLCVSTPSTLLEISDATPSKWWIARQEKDWFRLWPDELHAEYFHDDFNSRRADAVEKF